MNLFLEAIFPYICFFIGSLIVLIGCFFFIGTMQLVKNIKKLKFKELKYWIFGSGIFITHISYNLLVVFGYDIITTSKVLLFGYGISFLVITIPMIKVNKKK
jgi:hypothetical protein